MALAAPLLASAVIFGFALAVSPFFFAGVVALVPVWIAGLAALAIDSDTNGRSGEVVPLPLADADERVDRAA